MALLLCCCVAPNEPDPQVPIQPAYTQESKLPVRKAAPKESEKPNPKRSAKPKRTTAEAEYYANCTALREEHPRGIPQGSPGYRSALDRDKDGWACER